MTLPEFDCHDQSELEWERIARSVQESAQELQSIMEEMEHDDLMDADAYDRRGAQRDGWTTGTWDGRW